MQNARDSSIANVFFMESKFKKFHLRPRASEYLSKQSYKIICTFVQRTYKRYVCITHIYVMSQYIVSARKYRPDSFESLIGQDNIVKTLKNSILRGQLAHAYLFCGPRGVGKTSAARIFAKTINCSNPSEDMVPCGECESCVSFAEGRSYCIHELDAASNNGVEDIKALIEQVNVPPQVGRYSVFIIDEVHMLTQSAFNAFLKTLEEPPAHAIFILATTEKHKILPTILSRCQTYDFNRISIPDIVMNLREISRKEGISIDDESLHVIAQKADGAMRDALTIFDQTVAFCGTDVKYEDVLKNLNVLSYEHSFALVDSFLKGDYGAALLKFDEILSKGFNALYFVSALSQHFRDLIVAKSGGLDVLLELPDSLKRRYQEQSVRCQLKFLYDALTVTVACESGYKASVNPRLHVEFALMKLSFLAGAGEVSLKPAEPQVQKPAEPAVRPVARQDGQADRHEIPAAPAAREHQSAAEPAAAAPVPDAANGGQPAPAGETGAPVPEQTQEAAEEPVKTAAGASEEAGQPRRRSPRRPSSLTISAFQKEDTVVREDAAVQTVKDDFASDEDIMEAWRKLPAENAERPRLAKMLSTAKVTITKGEDAKIVDFRVINLAQQQWVEQNLLHQLEARLVQLSGSRKLKLTVSVQPDEQVEAKPYMPEEKAIELMRTNPEVKNLVRDFDLDTK